MEGYTILTIKSMMSNKIPSHVTSDTKTKYVSCDAFFDIFGATIGTNVGMNGWGTEVPCHQGHKKMSILI